MLLKLVFSRVWKFENLGNYKDNKNLFILRNNYCECFDLIFVEFYFGGCNGIRMYVRLEFYLLIDYKLFYKFKLNMLE